LRLAHGCVCVKEKELVCMCMCVWWRGRVSNVSLIMAQRCVGECVSVCVCVCVCGGAAVCEESPGCWHTGERDRERGRECVERKCVCVCVCVYVCGGAALSQESPQCGYTGDRQRESVCV